MVKGVSMTRCRSVLAAAFALSLTGCATRQFVQTEITRSENALRPAIEQLADDLREHQAEVRNIAAQVADGRRDGEEATRAAIEALGMADVAAGRAADAVEHATVAQRRADEAVAAADATAERLTRLWRARARLSVVEAIVLPFRVDEWTLGDQARATLVDIARRLQENPALVVELEGYADSAGVPTHNLRISQLRAETVGRFLAEQGVETHRLQAIGMGTARPIADNATVEGRRQNRRVVVRLLDPL